MKVFQILDGMCHHYHPEYNTAEEASRFFHPSFVFVDAPDFVFEGWGYDDTKTGDDRFIQPEAPEGWVYDEETGTFYIDETDKSYTQLYTELQATQAALDEANLKILGGE